MWPTHTWLWVIHGMEDFGEIIGNNWQFCRRLCIPFLYSLDTQCLNLSAWAFRTLNLFLMHPPTPSGRCCLQISPPSNCLKSIICLLFLSPPSTGNVIQCLQGQSASLTLPSLNSHELSYVVCKSLEGILQVLLVFQTTLWTQSKPMHFSFIYVLRSGCRSAECMAAD